MGKKSHAIWVVAVIVTGLACSKGTAQSLSLIDLGVGTSAYGINASGEITGCAPAGAGAIHAFMYSAGVMTDLGTLGGTSSCGYAINVSGQVTGSADTAIASTSHAFLYGNGTMTDLGTVGGEPTSVGVSINAHGDVVGYAWPFAPFAPLQPPGLYGAAGDVVPPIYGGAIAHAFQYRQGVITDLFPSPPGPVGSFFAFAINGMGQIAGDVASGCGIVCPYGTAFTLVGGVSTNLRDLPGNDGQVFLTAITGINDAGQIVAYGEDPLAFMHGVIYTNGVPLDLGNNTEAFAINSSGDVVGFKLGNSPTGLYGKIGVDMTPFIYSQGAKRDLNLPGAIPTGINDSGWIIANHLTLNHAYVLEPSNISLAPFGLAFGSTTFGQANPIYACGSCTTTLANNTANTIGVAGVATAGDFAQTNTCSGSLAPGASCVIAVRFVPTLPETALGALMVSAGGNQYATLLSGNATITAQLSSSPAAAVAGMPFTLTWKATPGSTCTAGGDTQFNGSVAVSGSKAITESAAQTTTFTLDCTQATQSAHAQAVVTISPPSSSGGGSGAASGKSGGGALDLASVAALLTLWGLRRFPRALRGEVLE